MNGTTLRIAAAVACVAALAAPTGALAKPTKHRVAHQTQQVLVPHKYLAGGDGIELTPWPANTRLNLFDPVQLAQGLGNQLLGQLGLPPLPTV